MKQTMIHVEGLSKYYGKTKAVDSIDFDVEKGQIYGLLGPNGAGKTTTLECIEGLRSFEKGRIVVDGYHPRKDSAKLRNKVGIQLQSSSLPGSITVGEAMALVSASHKVDNRQDLLERFGMNQEIKKRYHELSTGQKRRLHLALALVSHPSILVLDEPTAGLDVEGRASLHQEIRRLKEDKVTMLLATHDMSEAEELCDRLSIILRGKVAVTGSPEEVVKASHRQTKVAIKTLGDCLRADMPIEGASFFQREEDYNIWFCHDLAMGIYQMMQCVKEAGDKVIDLKVEQPSLEESFLEFVTGGGNR